MTIDHFLVTMITTSVGKIENITFPISNDPEPIYDLKNIRGHLFSGSLVILRTRARTTQTLDKMGDNSIHE